MRGSKDDLRLRGCRMNSRIYRDSIPFVPLSRIVLTGTENIVIGRVPATMRGETKRSRAKHNFFFERLLHRYFFSGFLLLL